MAAVRFILKNRWVSCPGADHHVEPEVQDAELPNTQFLHTKLLNTELIYTDLLNTEFLNTQLLDTCCGVQHFTFFNTKLQTTERLNRLFFYTKHPTTDILNTELLKNTEHQSAEALNTVLVNIKLLKTVPLTVWRHVPSASSLVERSMDSCTASALGPDTCSTLDYTRPR